MPNRLLRAAIAAALALAVLPAAATAARPPRAPRMTVYPASIDVAGWVDFSWNYDNTQQCQLGEDMAIDEELSFELARPRRVILQVIGGAVMTNFARGGTAKLKTRSRAYRTTNYCPPSRPARLPDPPACKTMSGRSRISLSPEPEESGDLTSLARGVMVNIGRIGGGRQDMTCMRNRPSVHPPYGTVADTLPFTEQTISFPIGQLSMAFAKLRVGQRISRVVTLGPGCDPMRVRAGAARLDSNIRRCTIEGRVVVMVKRLPGRP